MTKNQNVLKWVDEMRQLCQPDQVVWLDGSQPEHQRLTQESIRLGEIEPLDPNKLPGCYYSRSDVNDVARTEHLTFICARRKEDVGPTNNWMDPQEAYRKVGEIFRGAMKGRTMYVIPFIMGPAHSPFSKVGVQLTDSIYVVLNMRIMTRMGNVAWEQLGSSDDFTRCLHAKEKLDINRRYICHFPEDNTIWSVGSAYGGNALLGKKCLALRIGSFLGRQEGWLAEHMLIVGIEDPKGNVTYICAAFPSQCGKTNLAMLVPPAALKGYKVWTVGDDIAWLRIGADGRLWATNPEYGFFGVAPGTNRQSNPNALATIQRNTLFTNVVKTRDNTVWWEGLENPPEEGMDWRGKPWKRSSGEKGAHPNSRFTAPASQCPSIAPNWEDPKGVPISAIVFGGRRAKVAPLVYQSFNWTHGVFVGATMASETTAAQQGSQIGVVRRDPMAMLPFCGYNMADYFTHWLAMGDKIKNPPSIFHVNWFRTGADGKFLWPGFGENLRAVLWMIDRIHGSGRAIESPIGYIPTPDSLRTDGLSISSQTIQELLTIDPQSWQQETKDIEQFFNQFGDRLPSQLKDELVRLQKRLSASNRKINPTVKVM